MRVKCKQTKFARSQGAKAHNMLDRIATMCYHVPKLTDEVKRRPCASDFVFLCTQARQKRGALWGVVCAARNAEALRVSPFAGLSLRAHIPPPAAAGGGFLQSGDVGAMGDGRRGMGAALSISWAARLSPSGAASLPDCFSH